jgi:hypothetical protein
MQEQQYEQVDGAQSGSKAAAFVPTQRRPRRPGSGGSNRAVVVLLLLLLLAAGTRSCTSKNQMRRDWNAASAKNKD